MVRKLETKSKSKIWAIIGSGTIAAALLVVLCLLLLKPDDNEAERISVRNTAAASFEFIDDKDKGYKLFTSEIATLWTFDSLTLEPSEEELSEDWVYRIIFNPGYIVKNGNEIVILFGENNLSVNGKTYVASAGVDYNDILNWAKWKYDYYDYELRQ